MRSDNRVEYNIQQQQQRCPSMMELHCGKCGMARWIMMPRQRCRLHALPSGCKCYARESRLI
jgi:hypothetical protein